MPYIGSEAHGRLVKATGDRDWIPNFKELKVLMSKAGQSSGPSSSAAKTSKLSKDWKSKGTYVSTILLIYELQMLDEGMSRPRCPFFTPQTFRSVVGIEGNEFVLKNAFVGVSNDLYVFVVV